MPCLSMGWVSGETPAERTDLNSRHLTFHLTIPFRPNLQGGTQREGLET